MQEYRVLKMFSEELNKDKRIFIYLPKTYNNSDKFYPVLYMHDGHNLFDDNQATYGKSWGIMKSYEEIPDIPELIIVGIETEGESRADELIPFKFLYPNGKEYGGKTDLYMKFILSKVKPYIDSHFRAFKSPKNTGIMGSSFGGVNAAYAALKYSDYFTRFGCVSNAFHYGGFFEELKKMAIKSDLSTVKKLYMDVGTKETDETEVNKNYIESNKEMYTILKDKIPESQLRFEIIKDAIHNERDWEKRFPSIIKFLFND